MTTRITYLKDYTPPSFLIDETALKFAIYADKTIVSAILHIRRNPKAKSRAHALVLDGANLILHSLALDGAKLTSKDYAITKENLTIHKVPDKFILQTEVEIHPHLNTTLYGMYKSGNIFCSLCEPHGFHHITYFIDRPDILTHVTVTLSADKTLYPTLLANGNLISTQDLDNNRHEATWNDPSLKSIYLFALVAGNLDFLQDKFITRSGKEITLRIYAEHNYVSQCTHAMQALKQAMLWDEKVYGREYDLENYMIVAINDFNVGAMESKGLNLFNSKYVFVSPQTATDNDYVRVATVIAHEYFHNWRGNRVACRDWFQLSLKEGFVSFCDQQFTADTYSKITKRIQDVELIKTDQFNEDDGPLAHPVRPASYQEVSNFYTLTIYDKGAEVIRMLQTILGVELFRKTSDLFFDRYDGKTVTIEDFLKIAEESANISLKQFQRWYDQAGTPTLQISSKYDAKNKTYTLVIKQTSTNKHNKPWHIPLTLGLLNQRGEDMPLQLKKKTSAPAPTSHVLQIRKASTKFKFYNVAEKPVPSLLRNFSAPVKLKYSYTDSELELLVLHDSDDFNRWNASQQFMTNILIRLIEAYQNNHSTPQETKLTNILRTILTDNSLAVELCAELLQLPSEAYLLDQLPYADVDAVHVVSESVKLNIAQTLRAELLQKYISLQTTQQYVLNPATIGARKLRNTCLSYLLYLDDASCKELCVAQYQNAANMTDMIGALIPLANSTFPEGEQLLEDFYHEWQDNPLVVEKWLQIQAQRKQPGTLNSIIELTKHPAFDRKNPNKARALIGVFTHANLANFHQLDGAGYKFLAEEVLKLDALNPYVAARLIQPLCNWRRFSSTRQNLMKAELQRIIQKSSISRNLHEVVNNALK